MHAAVVTDAILNLAGPADLIEAVIDKDFGGLVAEFSITNERTRLQGAAGDDARVGREEASRISDRGSERVGVERRAIIGQTHAEGESAERARGADDAVVGITQRHIGVIGTVERLEEPHRRVGPDVVAETEPHRGGPRPIEGGAQIDIDSDGVATGVQLAHGETHAAAGRLRDGVIAPGQPEARATIVASDVTRAKVESGRLRSGVGVGPRVTARGRHALTRVGDGIDPGLTGAEVHGAARRVHDELQGVPATLLEPITERHDDRVDRGAREAEAETDGQLVGLDVQGDVGHLDPDVVRVPEGDHRLQDDVALVEAGAIGGGRRGEDELHAGHDRVAVNRLVVIIHRVAPTGTARRRRRAHLHDLRGRTRDHRLAVLQHVVDHRVPAPDRRDEAQPAVGAGVRVGDIAATDTAVVGPVVHQGMAALVAVGRGLAVKVRTPEHQVGGVGRGVDLRLETEEWQRDRPASVEGVDVVPGLREQGEVAPEAAGGRIDQESRRVSGVVMEACFIDDADRRRRRGLGHGSSQRTARRQDHLHRRLGQAQRGKIDAAEGARAARRLNHVGGGGPADGRQRCLHANQGLLVLARHPPREGTVIILIGNGVREGLRGKRHAVRHVQRRGVDPDQGRGVGQGRRKKGGEVARVGPQGKRGGGGADHRRLAGPRPGGARRRRVGRLDRWGPRQARGLVEGAVKGAAHRLSRHEDDGGRPRRSRRRRGDRGHEGHVGVGGQPTQEAATGVNRPSRHVIVVGRLEVVIRARQRTAEVVGVAPLVVEPFPAAPDPEHREVEGVQGRTVVKGVGRRGDAGVGAEQLLHVALGEPQGGDGVEAGAG